jgi:tetratricopeptide (TPR) repeat protein
MAAPVRHIVARTAAQPQVAGVAVSGWAALRGLPIVRECGRLAVCDLTLGAWRGHAAAGEFAVQLGVDFPGRPDVPSGERTQLAESDPPLYADVIGKWIDAEGRGDATILSALERAAAVSAVALSGPPILFVVLLPRFGIGWEPENEAFVGFLAHGLRGSASALLLVNVGPEGTGPAQLPRTLAVQWADAPSAPAEMSATVTDALAWLVPGLLDAEVTAALGDSIIPSIPLAGGMRLVPPEWRSNPRAVKKPQLGQLFEATPCTWLRAYAQYFGLNYHVDALFLCREAAKRLAEGGVEIALRLVERAWPCGATSLHKALVLMHAQGWRVACQKFAEAAAAPDAPPDIPSSLRGALNLFKGWGSVMAGDPAVAEAYLRSGRDLLAEVYRGRHEFLYVLNIYALSRFKTGDVEGALQIESSIESAIQADIALAETSAAGKQPSKGRDWPLEYVNSINIARVHRRRSAFDLSAQYYDRAFDGTLGARTESDAVYTNVCRALVNSRRGRLDQALAEWLRAALHWVSASVPEALGTRVVQAIVGRASDNSMNQCERVSSSLAAHLTQAAHAAGKDIDLSKEFVPPTFLKMDAWFEECPPVGLVGVGAPGWGLFGTEQALDAGYDGPEHAKLRRLLWAMLRPDAAWPQDRPIATILVDDRFGQEIPVRPIELLECCVRLGAGRLVWRHTGHSISGEMRAALEADSRVSLGPAVDRVEPAPAGAMVAFKRYRPPIMLDRDDATVASEAGRVSSVGKISELLGGRPADQVIQALRRLERQRIIVLSNVEPIPLLDLES